MVFGAAVAKAAWAAVRPSGSRPPERALALALTLRGAAARPKGDGVPKANGAMVFGEPEQEQHHARMYVGGAAYGTGRMAAKNGAGLQ